MTEYSRPELNQTRFWTELDFVSPGKRSGELKCKYSNNELALGIIPIPAAVIINGSGPTVLMIGGVHGDEYEGPVALLKFFHQVDVSEVSGRIIMLPALNFPAVDRGSRVSPWDDGNLNRAFPGDANGGPTEMIANLVESAIMPVCDGVLDLHSGGKAAWFTPCSMAMKGDDEILTGRNLELADVFGTDIVWLMGELSDDRSVNNGALRNNIPMISVELGGGGQVTPETLRAGEAGMHNFLRYFGVLEGKPQPRSHAAKYLEFNSPSQSSYAPHRGLFEPCFTPGDNVTAGEVAGYIHHFEDISKPPTAIRFPIDGIAMMRCHRGLVEHGELLGMFGLEVDPSNRQ
ncbi:MAG: succinylglutamate desuccinylase/aspartoacylase family protein [Acidiferrobacterales bacterium]|nr:succinylglutamate desuccinylase/aspartoacylase family protein [Acidiferrobacterales bacterium]